MSRVFEALTKATHQYKRDDARPDVDLSSTAIQEAAATVSVSEASVPGWDAPTHEVDFIGPPNQKTAPPIFLAKWSRLPQQVATRADR